MTELNQNNININNMVLWLSKCSMFIPSAFINSVMRRECLVFFFLLSLSDGSSWYLLL